MAPSAADTASDITLDLSVAESSFAPGEGEAAGWHPVRRLTRLFAAARELPRRVIALSTAARLPDAVFPLVLLVALDRAGSNQALQMTLGFVAVLFCAVVVGAYLRQVRNKLLADFATSEIFDLQMHAAHHFLHLEGPAVFRISPPAASNVFRAIDEWSRYARSPARLTALEAPFIVLNLLMFGFIGGVLVAVPVVLTFLFVLWMAQSRAAMGPLALEVAAHDRKRFDFQAESIEAFATVKALAIEPRMQRRHESQLHHAARATEEAILQKMRIHEFGYLFEMVMFFPVAVAGCVMATEGVLSIGAAASCSFIAVLVARSARRLVAGMEQTEAAEIALERAKEFLAEPERVSERIATTGPAKVQLNGVRMDEPDLVESARGINLTIRAGEAISIVVRDDHSRLMFGDILRGRIDPDHGEYLIDGCRISEQPAALQRVMIVDGSPAIFHGTIIENISMFGAINAAAAVEMAQRMAVEPEILSLPEGYHTKLAGKETLHISSALLVAIALVRAAAIRPGLLILDVDRSMLTGIAARACENMLVELRGSVTILMLGRTLLDLASDGRSYKMEEWSLTPVEEAIRSGDDGPGELEALDES